MSQNRKTVNPIVHHDSLYQKHIGLAEKAVAYVKKNIETGHDILDCQVRIKLRDETKRIIGEKNSPDPLLCSYLKNFKLKDIIKYYEHVGKSTAARNNTQALLKTLERDDPAELKKIEKFTFPDLFGQKDFGFVFSFLSGLSGYGECSETAALTAMKLLEAQCELPIYYIGVRENSERGVIDRNHGFLILGGNCDKLTAKDLKSLNSNLIYVDPLLNIITSADKAAASIEIFVNLQNSLVEIFKITPDFAKQAKILVELGAQYKQIITMQSTYLREKELLSKIFNQLKLEALKKYNCGTTVSDMEKCLRNIAANGDKDNLLIMIQCVLISNGNIHATSANGNSALDWAKEKGHKACVEMLLNESNTISTSHVVKNELFNETKNPEITIKSTKSTDEKIRSSEKKGLTTTEKKIEIEVETKTEGLMNSKKSLAELKTEKLETYKLQPTREGIEACLRKAAAGNDAKGVYAMIGCLGSVGGNIDAPSKNGNSALDWARQNKCDSCIDLLLAHGAKNKSEIKENERSNTSQKKKVPTDEPVIKIG